ncbi:MAG TPA: TAT-variant-translocated molybdopterin oxidoreductase [Chitinophagaceae bacterium]|jgi:molybdopterin-containing oxidoreductase family iron-sulfur binding subunit|nr:TAT-variant-translocated molybdopterin oxidoreductase [Chitinophagaceae bacterium]
MSNKYWQSFGEVNDPENLKKLSQDEFQEELPFEGFDDKGLIDAKAPRRDFLKYLGFSTAAATLAASCKIPVRKAVPYANKPENLVPGVAKYYATTYIQDGDVIPVVAKVRDGRPIKIEGNTLATHTGGGTTARSQASVLDLYDMYRAKFPLHKVKNKFEEVPAFEQFDKMVGDAMKAAGGSVVLLTSTIVSASTKDIIAKFPNLKHVQYDAVSYSGMLLANEASGFGRKLPTYDFSAAKVIVSLGADFLGTWLSPVENARGYSKGRKIDEKSPSMSKHYHFEGHLSMTGSNADERYTHRPSETGAVALALLAAVNGGAASVADAKLKAGVEKAAADLKAHNGAALVVCGSNDKNVQLIVNAINAAIGANGTTINWNQPVNYRQGIDSDMVQLVADMEAGTVGTIMIQGANPAYTYFDADKFKAALKKVKLSVSFNEKMDETSELCEYIVPNHHYLESWGDAEPKAGVTSFMQPTIYPLFKTRYFQTSLLRWSGSTQDYETYFKEYWVGKLGSEDAFNKALQDGVKEDAATAGGGGSYGSGGVAEATTAIGGYNKGSGTEVVFYEKVSLGTGSQAGNPWLQELPDPVSKATWDNYALISMKKAEELGIKLNVDYEYYPEKPVIEVTIGKNKVELPILVLPGMNADTIAIAVGYGRNEAMGVTAAGVGKNVYGYTTYNGSTVDNYVTGASTTNLHKKYKIAQTQKHNYYEDRKEVVRETTLASFNKAPDVIPEWRNELRDAFYKNANNDFRQATLYPQHEQPGIKWGMNIDMNACFGCGACVVACNAENNIPVVGKREVLRYHDMHWLRIDRYFISDEKDPDSLKGVVFQPMLCQHCDNAPCENVCPVAATNHSSEGLNQMTYNRCIGTRYCANNCPFKVRRFNWADYTGADSFPNNRDQKLVGKLDNVIEQMNDDLTRMVLNPDVTVRSRGVIEKCSFCVQKLQAAKLDAKKENRMLKDGDAKTACQMACSADAIVFGNAHDKDSQLTKIRNENPQRTFNVLEQLHVLPNITYLAKIRNSEEIDAHWAGEHHEEANATGEHKEGVKEEGHKTDSISLPSSTKPAETVH